MDENREISNTPSAVREGRSVCVDALVRICAVGTISDDRPYCDRNPVNE
jgi:hypothetical protein